MYRLEEGVQDLDDWLLVEEEEVHEGCLMCSAGMGVLELDDMSHM